MTTLGYSGWYPPSQIIHPPELPSFLRNVYDLKPIVGVPSDVEVIGVQDVIHAARKASEIPGMGDPDLTMRLTDHLFGAQMARYRNRYSLVTFPTDATYTPPALPAHVTANLGSICGTPSDEEVMKVQDAIQTYQEFRRVPSMFDTRVNMELSQHLFDIQMARHMRLAGESTPNSAPQVPATSEPPVSITEWSSNQAEQVIASTNNPGTGASATAAREILHSTPAFDARDLMERSNQLAERFNQLLEQSNRFLERCSQSAYQSNSQILDERFDRVFERLTQLAEHSHRPAQRPDELTERFNELFERFDQLAERSDQSTREANRLAERSNQLSEQANKSWERLGDVLGNINKVLVRIQHAIVRSHKGNTTSALDCLVNERGETPAVSDVTSTLNFRWISKYAEGPQYQLPVVINGAIQDVPIPVDELGKFLRFYGIGSRLFSDETSVEFNTGEESDARAMLEEYLSSCLG